MFKRTSRSSSAHKETSQFERLPLSWEPLEGRREQRKPHWGKKLAIVGGMYLAFTVIAFLWDRFVNPRYDWALILVFVAVLVVFGLALRRQQRNLRNRLLRSKQ
jgi:hypothetical protein